MPGRSILKKHNINSAYANYQPDALANYEAAYWAGNAPRLAAIKARVDPLGIFSKPGTMQCMVAAAGGPATATARASAPAPVPAPGSAAGQRSPLTGAAVLAAVAAAAALLV